MQLQQNRKLAVANGPYGPRPLLRRMRGNSVGGQQKINERMKMSFGRYFLGSVAVGALLMTAVPVKAQSLNSQVQNLKQQIQQLNQQLQNLQNQVQQTQQKQAQTDATVSQIKTAPATAQASGGAPFLKMSGISPTFSSPDGNFTLSPTGRLHFDMGDYLSYSKA